MFETVNDGGGVVNLNTYPKQPFDFTGRTGEVTFDVSADSDGCMLRGRVRDHRQAGPGVRRSISCGVPAAAANEVGFSLDGCSAGLSGNDRCGDDVRDEEQRLQRAGVHRHRVVSTKGSSRR